MVGLFKLNRSKRIKAAVQFKYTHPRYVSFQPHNPRIECKKSRKERRRFEEAIYKKGYYTPGYPTWTTKEVLAAKIKDLREEDIVLNGLYEGEISIILKEVRNGSSIVVGRLADRAIQPQQWQFRYKRRLAGRTKEHDVWGTVPTGVFEVNMSIEMPKDNYDSLMKCSKAITKLSASDLAEKKLTDIRVRLNEIKDMEPSEIEELTKKEAEFRSVASIAKLSRHTLSSSGPELVPPLLEILSHPKSTLYKGIQSFLKETYSKNPQREWAKELLELRQQMIADKESGRKKHDYHLKRNARKTLDLIKKADDAAEDLFKIFRYYMNLHLASIKYQMDQYWIDLIPEWAMDYFYSRNKVIIDNQHILAIPVFSVGALWMHKKGGADNIRWDQWKSATEIPIGKTVTYSHGFRSEGLLTRAYGALLDDECEICVVLSSAAVEREFAEIYRRIKQDKEVKLDEQVKLPPRPKRLKKMLDRWEPFLLKHAYSLKVSKQEVRTLIQKQRYQRELRNESLHHGITIKVYIERADAGQNDYFSPSEFNVDISRKSSHKKPKPYHWRVADDLHRASWDMRELLIHFRTKYLISIK